MRLVPENSPTTRLILFSIFPLMVGALLLVRLAPEFVLRIAHCPLRDMTGMPCPTCGGTLAATRLVQAHWLDALSANPLVVLVALVYVLLAASALAMTLVPSWRRGLALSPREKRTARWLAILLLILNWAWLVKRYLF